MDEFAPFAQSCLLESVLDEIFDSLDIMVGDLFYVLHPGCILRGHVPVYVPEESEFFFVKICKLRKRNFA